MPSDPKPVSSIKPFRESPTLKLVIAILVALLVICISRGLIFNCVSGLTTNFDPSVCSGAENVRLDANFKEREMLVRKDCLSGEISWIQPEGFSLMIDKRGDIRYYVSAGGRLLGPFKSLKDADNHYKIGPADNLRIIGYDGTATLRLEKI
ncbi:MAG: hypothetical protein HZB99_04475 [Candidatus Harrisonbacteria bacterium]|nr:hypothetical protein [Candidatus Harrisonbacteria bacterium]